MECIRDAFKQLKEVIHDVGTTSQDVSGKVAVWKVAAGEAKEVEIAVKDNHTFEEILQVFQKKIQHHHVAVSSECGLKKKGTQSLQFAGMQS